MAHSKGPSAPIGDGGLDNQLGHERIRTTLKHYARFVPAVDERSMRLLDDFAAQAADDVSNACHADEANGMG